MASRMTPFPVVRSARAPVRLLGALAPRFRDLLCLGVSLGTIMPLPSGALTIHAAHQLVYEFDHARSSGAAAVVTDLVRARQHLCMHGAGAAVSCRARLRAAAAALRLRREHGLSGAPQLLVACGSPSARVCVCDCGTVDFWAGQVTLVSRGGKFPTTVWDHVADAAVADAEPSYSQRVTVNKRCYHHVATPKFVSCGGCVGGGAARFRSWIHAQARVPLRAAAVQLCAWTHRFTVRRLHGAHIRVTHACTVRDLAVRVPWRRTGLWIQSK